jgi:hypothetical protein
MIAKSFDDSTCREVTGDGRSKSIEEKARKDAETANYDPPKISKTGSYWSEVTETMEMYVYIAAYKKRVARIERMNAK